MMMCRKIDGLAVAAALVLAAFSSAAAAQAPAFVWIEGEKPASASFEFNTDGSDLLSGGQRLHHAIQKHDIEKTLPAEGLKLTYDFNLAEGGPHEFWVRLSYEFIRAPIRWRVDDGQWRELSPEVLTTSLMEIFTWTEIAWALAGNADLGAGKHTLELHLTRPGSDRRLLLGLDCMAFVKGEGNFIPDGYLKPGQTYDAEVDRNAAAQVYGADGKSWPVRKGRPQLELSGPWEVARWDDVDMDKDTYEAVRRIPAADEYPLHWMGVEVPGDMHKQRPEMRFGHRYLCRTRAVVPAEYRGRGIHLHFTESAWILSVFVNGRFVGDHTTVMVPWDMDITSHLRPGEVNEIIIGVKSSWYALDPTFGRTKKPSVDHCRNMPTDLGNARWWGYVDAVYSSAAMPNGFRGPIRLVATGPAHTSDIYIRTSVAQKRLEADVEVANVTGAAIEAEVTCEAVNDRTGAVEKTFGPARANVPAGKAVTVALTGDWENPRLWWPEPKANVYRMRTTVRIGGRVADVQEELFGFREVSYDGRHFLLNGIRWHFWCWQGLGRKIGSPEEWVNRYHARNHRFIRTHGTRGPGKSEDDMDIYDRGGIAQFCPTWINGMYLVHQMDNPILWKNFDRHVRQYVKAYRNRPSILAWSLGNELMLVNARLGFFNQYAQLEDEAAKLVAAQIEVDPTRRSFFDGGGDLGGRIELDNNHYGWRYGAGFPACAYRYPTGPAILDPRPRDRAQLYLWTGDKPLIFGEVFHYQLGTPDMSWIGGPSVYRSVRHQDVAATRYMRIAVEGARWQDTTGICLFGEVDGYFKDTFRSYEPRAVFVREHNSGFYSGRRFERTIRVFNDGRTTDPLTLKWSVVLDGEVVLSGEKTYSIEPGHHEGDTIGGQLPTVTRRVRGHLNLELYAQGERVFDDTKAVVVAPPPSGPGDVEAGNLFVFDPKGQLVPWLTERNVAHTAVADLAGMPAAAKIVLVGPQALTRQNRRAAGRKVREMVLAGGTAVVLEQSEPLQGDDLPLAGIKVPPSETKEPPGMAEFSTGAGGRSGAIAHPVALAHPVLKDVAPDDLFTWAGDEFNFRRSYGTPTEGAISIIQAGDKLSLTPMMEVAVGQGSYLLSQMLIGEKLSNEPTADQLLHNALAWAQGRAASPPGKTLVVGATDALRAMLDSTGLVYEQAPAFDQATDALDSDWQLLIVRATPKSTKWLAHNASAVRKFCEQGRWVMLTDLDSEGLASFNKLVGFEHRIRPFGAQAARVQRHADPLLLGLSDRDFSQFADKMIAPWVRKYWVSDEVFTQVVDGDDIGGFVKCRYPNLFNGLTNVDFWRYIQYFQFEGDAEGTIVSGQGEKEPAAGREGIWIDIAFDRPETITGLNIQLSQIYYTAKDIKIVFDDNQQDALSFALANNSDKQAIEFPQPRRIGKISIVVLSHYGGISSRNMKIVTFDTVEVLRQMPEGGPVALTNPGGLVKYPVGKGGILLNQLDYAAGPDESIAPNRRKNFAENVKKKRAIYANLLRNMGASFKLK